MKYYISLLFFLFVFMEVKAQVTPIYFYGDQIITDKDKATSYAVYGKLSNEDLWVFKRYDLFDNLMQTGSYKNEELSIPHGKFVFYMDIETFNINHNENFKLKGKTRFVSQEGNFVNGVEDGKWLLYYPDGNIFNIQNYANGKLNGEFKTFDRLGNLKIDGKYVMGVREGEWYFNKGTRKEVYENGVLKSNAAVKKPKKENQSVVN